MTRHPVLRSKNLYAAAAKSDWPVHRQDLALATQVFDFALKPAKRLWPAAPSRQVRKELGFTPSYAATRVSETLAP